ncbi:ABC transporter ATP-binding protein [Solimonas sp. K1W22B-7]|uniref:ABC transporter ATP-binding protein n=1 Tax=Solimonas sp. K1W22B-7 TaxID=2303331 RepID=UPI000E32DFF6|nr:ABC transporter ATP-binding protein [Solimonas sp. K1W22B-7]AXQ29245.1 ABC transporter ATP-binding protein [Solimonas sp. K1W22B-7]
MPAILSVRDLRKHYPGVKAVDGISLDVQEGQCLGLLGPNGAGKSTTVEMLEGLVRPTSGEILFRGRPIDADYRECIGIQFQHTALQDFLTVRENLQFFRSLYRKTLPIQQLVEACRLEEYLDRDHRKLSGGQRQRMLLAIALVNDPDVVFLDEPTTGLDPQARRNFWDLVLAIKARGKTVVLTTHYMEEAYLLCDDIAIMDHGHVIARGSPQQLLADNFNDSVLELPATEVEGRELDLPLVRRADRVEIMSADVNGAVQKMLAAGLSLAQLKIRPRTLEDLFLQLTGTELRA